MAVRILEEKPGLKPIMVGAAAVLSAAFWAGALLLALAIAWFA